MKTCHARGQVIQVLLWIPGCMFGVAGMGTRNCGITRCGLYLDVKCIDLTLQLDV